MKTLKLIPTILFLVFLSFSCGSDDSDPQPNCDQIAAETQAAKLAFDDANSSNYTNLCNAYKTALQRQINECGDGNGSLQNIINGLNCTLPTTTGTLSMNLGSAPLVFDVITVTTNGTTRHVHGEKSNTTSYEIDFDVEIGQTGLNKINNFQIRLFSQNYTPLIPAVFGNSWTSNITVNSGTSVVGTFRGELANASQTSVQDLLNGVVDIDF